jgi:hypothetical protein
LDEISVVAGIASLIAGLLLLISYGRHSRSPRVSVLVALAIVTIFFSASFPASIYYTILSAIILLVAWKSRQNRMMRDHRALEERLQLEAKAYEEERKARERIIAEGKEVIAWSPKVREQQERTFIETLDRLMDGQIAVLDSPSVRVAALVKELGWTEGACILLAEGLGLRGLVELHRINRMGRTANFKDVTSLSLTKAGFERLEKMRKPEEAKFSRNLLINSIINVGSGNQQALNSTNTSQHADFADAAIAQLELLLGEYRKALETEAVDEEVQQLASADISALEVQLARKPLNTSVVKELIASLRAIAEGIAGSAVFSYLASRLGS